MNTHTEFAESVAPNPFEMLFPEHLHRMAVFAAASSVPSQHFSPLDKPTPKSVRTAQMQAADLLIDAFVEIESAPSVAPSRHFAQTLSDTRTAQTARLARHPVTLSRSELVRAVLA